MNSCAYTKDIDKPLRAYIIYLAQALGTIYTACMTFMIFPVVLMQPIGWLQSNAKKFGKMYRIKEIQGVMLMLLY